MLSAVNAEAAADVEIGDAVLVDEIGMVAVTEELVLAANMLRAVKAEGVDKAGSIVTGLEVELLIDVVDEGESPLSWYTLSELMDQYASVNAEGLF